MPAQSATQQKTTTTSAEKERVTSVGSDRGKEVGGLKGTVSVIWNCMFILINVVE